MSALLCIECGKEATDIWPPHSKNCHPFCDKCLSNIQELHSKSVGQMWALGILKSSKEDIAKDPIVNKYYNKIKEYSKTENLLNNII